MPPETRRFERSQAASDYRVGFRCGGQRFHGIPIKTLSAGGCSFEAPGTLVDLLDRLGIGILEELRIDHAELPEHALRARVAYTLGRAPLIVGVEFLDVPPAFRNCLLNQVQHLIRQQRSMSGY